MAWGAARLRARQGGGGDRNGEAREEELSQRDRAYLEIRRRILENELPAGSQMLETEVADLLQMSRTPVREALIRLHEEGLIEVRPRHGMRVRTVSPDDMAEIYDLLTALEATAAELAARRGLSKAEIAMFETAADDMDTALEAGDLRAWALADQRFHDHLVAMSGNKRLETVVATMCDQAHRVRMATLTLRPVPTDSNDDHRALIAAIRQNDADTAREIHHAHRRKSGEAIVGLLERLGLSAL